MNKIVKYFQDNEVTIMTDNPKFLKFVEDYLRNFSDKFIKKNKNKIRATVLWNDLFCDEFHDKIGKKVFKNGKKICYMDNHYHLIAEIDDGLDIKIYPRYTSFKNIVRELIKNAGKQSEYHFYQTLLRNVFHFPLFYNLEKEGFQFYHGSACKIRNNILIMPGAAGIGKTIANLCFHLIHPDAITISDNYLIFKKDKIYVFPEPLRLPAFFRKEIPGDFEPVFTIKKRDYYLKKNMCSQSFSLKNNNVYFISIVRGTKEFLKEIDSFTSKKILQSTTNYVSHEFHVNSWISFLPYVDTDVQDGGCSKNLSMISPSNSFICEVPRFNTLDDAVNTYRRVIENVLDEH